MLQMSIRVSFCQKKPQSVSFSGERSWEVADMTCWPESPSFKKGTVYFTRDSSLFPEQTS